VRGSVDMNGVWRTHVFLCKLTRKINARFRTWSHFQVALNFAMVSRVMGDREGS
jgi:hypothetical protein